MVHNINQSINHFNLPIFKENQSITGNLIKSAVEDLNVLCLQSTFYLLSIHIAELGRQIFFLHPLIPNFTKIVQTFSSSAKFLLAVSGICGDMVNHDFAELPV